MRYGICERPLSKMCGTTLLKILYNFYIIISFTGPVIEVSIPRSKSEPRSVTSSHQQLEQSIPPVTLFKKQQITQNHVTNNQTPIIKPKAPPPPPPTGVAPYLPPLRSQSQPPMVRFTSLEFSSPPKPIYYKPANQTCWYQRPPEQQLHINHQFDQVNHHINR